MEIIKNGLKDQILKEVEDRKQAVDEVSNRVDQIANNQIPEQYLQQAVDNYVNENNGGFATQDDLNEVKEDIAYTNDKIEGFFPLNITFTHRYLDPTSGVESGSPDNRIISNEIFIKSGGYIGTGTTFHQFIVFQYDAITHNFIKMLNTEWCDDSITVEEDGYYRIEIRLSNNGEIPNDYINTIILSLSINQNQYFVDYEKIVNNIKLPKRLDLGFEIGAFRDNGFKYDNPERARTKNIIYIPKGYIIKSLTTKYVFVLYSFTDNRRVNLTSSSEFQSATQITENGYYSIQVKSTDNNNADLTDKIDDIVDNVVCIKRSKTYLVDQDGFGDFKTIQQALNFADDYVNYQVTIFVNPGTYGRFSMTGFTLEPDTTYATTKLRDHYISIIGTDRDKCIIRSDAGNYNTPPAEIRTNGIIKNLTFISTHDKVSGEIPSNPSSYGIHMDFGKQDVVFENCVIKSNCGPAVGIGLYQDTKITMKNCELYATGNDAEYGNNNYHGAFFCHTNPNNEITGEEVKLINCIIESNNASEGAMSISKINDDEPKITSINTMYYSHYHNAPYISNNGFIITPQSYGNNIDTLNN